MHPQIMHWKRCVFFVSASLLLSVSLLAQSRVPTGISYQAVLRDSLTGTPIVKNGIDIRFTVRETSTSTNEYIEVHSNINTNQYGLINLVVGGGVPQFGTGVEAVKWNENEYEVGLELDTGAGFFSLGFSKLWTVPYTFMSVYSNYSDSARIASIADTAGRIKLSAGIPHRLIKVGPTGKFVKHSHIVEDTSIAGNSKVGFGIGSPDAGFHVKPEFGNHGFVVEGVSGTSFFPNTSGNGTRMMFVPAKSAFRVGTQSGLFVPNVFDVANIGNHSFAAGLDPLASGDFSMSMGLATKAIGVGSAALGGFASALDSGTVAFGSYVEAAARNNMVLGIGISSGSPLRNTKPNSLMIGFNSNIPTLYVQGAGGIGQVGKVSVGTSDPKAIFHVKDSSNNSPLTIFESFNPNQADVRIKAQDISGQEKIKLSYWHSANERASTFFDANGDAFVFTTDTRARMFLKADPSNSSQPNLTIGNTSLKADSNVRLSIHDGHMQVAQKIPPTVSGGSGAYSLALFGDPSPTDVAGKFRITTNNLIAGAQSAFVTFSLPYNTKPIVVISPANTLAASEMSNQEIYVDAIETGFYVRMQKPNTLRVGVMEFNYMVIETSN